MEFFTYLSYTFFKHAQNLHEYIGYRILDSKEESCPQRIWEIIEIAKKNPACPADPQMLVLQPEKKILTLWVATREIKAHFLLLLSIAPRLYYCIARKHRDESARFPRADHDSSGERARRGYISPPCCHLSASRPTGTSILGWKPIS